MNINPPSRDGALNSPWQYNFDNTPPKPAEMQSILDCLVIGGGITGLTAALLLQQAGKQTAIAEAHTIGFGTTGGTSAHINTFADTTYAEAESAFGEEGARLFARAIREGAELISNNVSTLNIDCDYESKTGYLYAEDEEQIKQLEEIYTAALKVGVPVNYTANVPTPVPFEKALAFEGQAQFDPIKYINGLKKAYIKAGGILFEHTLIEKVDSKIGMHEAHANKLAITAKAIIYATHMPPNISVFNFECAPYRSYVIAVKLKGGKYPDALIYDSQEPYHYVRTHRIDGEDLLLVGGLDHKTGHEDPEKAFAELEKYTKDYYAVSSVKYRWSSQYYIPADGLPYIGQMPLTADGIYCATGYNGNGMMLGSIAGRILGDLVIANDTPYRQLFNPARIKPIDSFSEFVKENADVAYHFIADRFNVKKTDSLKRLAPGAGKLLEVDGKKIAAYKDEQGNIHALNPVCTHAGCIVAWNAEERSWDCPCHGARYDIEGNVLTGPATRNLKTITDDES